MNSVHPDGAIRNPFVVRMSTQNTEPSCIERLDVAKNLYTDDSLLKAESKPQSRASNTCTNTTGTKKKRKENNFIDKDSLFIMIGNLSTEGVEQRARSLKMKVVVESVDV